MWTNSHSRKPSVSSRRLLQLLHKFKLRMCESGMMEKGLLQLIYVYLHTYTYDCVTIVLLSSQSDENEWMCNLLHIQLSTFMSNRHWIATAVCILRTHAHTKNESIEVRHTNDRVKTTFTSNHHLQLFPSKRRPQLSQRQSLPVYFPI